MSGQTKQYYAMHPMGVNASRNLGATIAGFLPVVSGTLTITAEDGTVLVNAVPITAGTYLPCPGLLPTTGVHKITLGGGAAGTLFC